MYQSQTRSIFPRSSTFTPGLVGVHQTLSLRAFLVLRIVGVPQLDDLTCMLAANECISPSLICTSKCLCPSALTTVPPCNDNGAFCKPAYVEIYKHSSDCRCADLDDDIRRACPAYRKAQDARKECGSIHGCVTTVEPQDTHPAEVSRAIGKTRSQHQRQ